MTPCSISGTGGGGGIRALGCSPMPSLELVCLASSQLSRSTASAACLLLSRGDRILHPRGEGVQERDLAFHQLLAGVPHIEPFRPVHLGKRLDPARASGPFHLEG